MKVTLFKADPGGSGTYRMEEPARVVRAVAPGIEITVTTDMDVDALRYLDGRVVVREVHTDADVIVLQRPMTQPHSEIARQAREQGIGVVVDIDDDFHNVHADNIAARSVDPKLDQWHNRLWLMRTVGFSNVVTVSTPALIKYPNHFKGAPHGAPHGLVVRNRIPERVLDVVADPDVAGTLGWTGTLQTHPADMARARGALDRTDAPFVVVGDSGGVARALGVPEDRVALVPWVPDPDGYWQAVASSFGVGIAPLEPSKFNKAKSWLKPAEYCSLGIPFVASPTPEYQALVAASGGGLVATSAVRWSRAVATVLDERERFATAALEWARAHTLERYANDWLSAWTIAAEEAKWAS